MPQWHDVSICDLKGVPMSGSRGLPHLWPMGLMQRASLARPGGHVNKNSLRWSDRRAGLGDFRGHRAAPT